MTAAHAQSAASGAPRLLFSTTAGEIQTVAARDLARVRALWRHLLDVAGTRTVANTWAVYDELVWTAAQVLVEGRLLARVHPDAALREAGETASRQAEQLATEVDLDPRVLAAIESIPLDPEDPPTRFAIGKVLRRMRRNGAGLPDATRAKVRELQSETVRLGLEFERHIQDRLRPFTFHGPAELEGLPADYVAAHPASADGTVRVTTSYPDAFPVFKYARSEAVRRRLAVEFLNQAYPENMAVLAELLDQRRALARELGYADYAAYATEDKMIGTPSAAAEFLTRVHRAAEAPARREFATLLARKRQDEPGATSVGFWDAAMFGGDVGYYTEKVRSEQFRADARELRVYFPFEKVRDGVMRISSELFGIRFVRVEEPRRWHPSVEVFDLFDGDQRLGRFYLDLHPREGKFTHAMCAEVVLGVAGRAAPEAALVCNFPEPGLGQPALMEPSDVLTFFHEFGHLLHEIFSGRARWTANIMGEIEWDFVEAPSQFLEEWVRDPATLRRFARHHATDEPIPLDLAERWRRAETVSQANIVLRLVAHAAISLEFYRRDPKEIDTTALARELWEKYQLVDWVDGAHIECRFGHLVGYSALYYTYSWSLVIAKDLFERFRAAGPLMNPEEGRRYRRSILEPGSSRPASELIQDYLGRPSSIEAFERWLSVGPSTDAPSRS
ncbi:MAG: Zn-dependent oligopeptidase [Thermoplasmata archaeon]|nr:Zn-dependent oligopeptidase [Thermoplasmata archaeon]